MSAIKPEGQLSDQPDFLSMLLQQLIRAVIYSEILIDPLALDESIISLKINYRMFKILQLTIFSTCSRFSNSTQPPAWSSSRYPPSLSSLNRGELTASLSDVSLTLISEYGEKDKALLRRVN